MKNDCYSNERYNMLNLSYTDGTDFSCLVGLAFRITLPDVVKVSASQLHCQPRAVNRIPFGTSVLPPGLSSFVESFRVPYSFSILAASSLVLSVSS